jgi:hypothetical protein
LVGSLWFEPKTFSLEGFNWSQYREYLAKKYGNQYVSMPITD